MQMTSSREFSPDWASPPGATISGILERRRMSTAELAQQLGLSADSVEALIEGRRELDSGTADRLARTVGGSAAFWITREAQYRAAVERVDAQWLNQFPIDDMVEFGWVHGRPNDLPVSTLLHFFDVPSVSAWRASYGGIQKAVAFRTSPSFDSHPAAVAA